MAGSKSCYICGEPFAVKNIRTVNLSGMRVFICKLCYLKLSEKDRANSKAQTKLVHEVEYTQGELPF